MYNYPPLYLIIQQYNNLALIFDYRYEDTCGKNIEIIVFLIYGVYFMIEYDVYSDCLKGRKYRLNVKVKHHYFDF